MGNKFMFLSNFLSLLRYFLYLSHFFSLYGLQYKRHSSGGPHGVDHADEMCEHAGRQNVVRQKIEIGFAY